MSKKIIFSHPVLEDKAFDEEGAKRLEELEKVNPSGWVRKSNEEESVEADDTSDNSNDSDDAVRDSGNKGNPKGKTHRKSKASTKGGKSRE